MVSEKVIRAMKNMYPEKYNELLRNGIEKVLGEEEADRLIRKRRREMLSPEEQKRLDKKLLEAVKNGEYKKVEELIKRGANVNEKDYEGKTALDRAVTYEIKEILKREMEKEEKKSKRVV